MGLFTDYVMEKGKNIKNSAGKYVGTYLIKEFFHLGTSSVNEMYKNLNEAKGFTTNDKDDATANVEKWLKNGDGLPKEPLLKGEAYLRMREENGLNLQEVDKYYTNLSLLCLLFIILMCYCFGSLIYYIATAPLAFWFLPYFLSGVLFALMFFAYSLNGASILKREQIDGKVFLTSPSLWFPRFKLPYDWRIKD